MFATQPADAANIAPSGIGIIGVNDAVDGDGGTPRANAGSTFSINDLDPSTRVDNWFGAAPTDQGQGISYVGISWPNKRFEAVNQLRLTLATFFDGGWFGKNATGPGAGGPLVAEDLVDPVVQISTNGTDWTTVPATSDYLSIFTGHTIGGGDNPNPTSAMATFTLTTPATEIMGVRIIGENGGTADGNGFIGVFELEVEATATDTDEDGMPDGWETANGLTVGSNDAASDLDSDGLINVDEFNRGTNPNGADTDGDGLADGAEIDRFTNPLLADTDGDGLSDGREANELGTDPLTLDSDLDGLADGDEVNIHETNPAVEDTDGDTYGDGVEVSQGSDPKDASSVPNNLAITGRGIMGTMEDLSTVTEPGTELFHVGTAENIVDGNLTTRVDTWNGDTPGTVSFVGVVWDTPVTDPVVSIGVTFATFFDGGWFGANGTGPVAGGPLTAAHLVEPQVQISTDMGASWTTVPHTSDYIDSLTGHGVGGGANPNPSTVKATFTLDTPTNNITGLRIIGTDGGAASGGFIGIFDFAVLSSASDSDSDGMDDAWERSNGLNVGTNDASADADSDGLTNLEEFTADTNPQLADTDGDGLNDGAEVDTHLTNPRRADTDTDGLADGAEINTHQTDPLKADTDNDGYPDGLEIAEGTNPKDAASVPSNLAFIGRGIMGTKESLESGPETEVPLFNAGSAESITDGNLATSVDTFNGAGTSTVSFVGILWDEPLTKPVSTVELTLATFFDGGWFGVNGVGPGSGASLSASEHLVEPQVQVTRDGGTNWTTVEATSDYIEALDGHPLPAVDFGPPTTVKATFELAEAETGINGIRIIGTEGGPASGGFLGVFDFAVPSKGGPAPGGGVTLLNVSKAENQFRFEIDTVAGESHVVQFRDAIGAGSWQPLTTITGDGTRKPVTDALSGAHRFYRVTTE